MLVLINGVGTPLAISAAAGGTQCILCAAFWVAMLQGKGPFFQSLTKKLRKNLRKRYSSGKGEDLLDTPLALIQLILRSQVPQQNKI